MKVTGLFILFLFIFLGASQEGRAFSTNSEIQSIEIKELNSHLAEEDWIAKWDQGPRSYYGYDTIKVQESTKMILAKVTFTKAVTNRYLFVGSRFIDRADFYSFKNSKVEWLATGGNVIGNDNLNIYTNSPLMKIPVAQPEESIYIKIQSPKFVHLAIDLKTSSEFKFEMEVARIIAYGFFGFIFMMTIVQVVVFFSFRNKNPVYYMIFAWSCAMAFYCSSGVAGYFFDSPIPVGASFYANWFFTATLHLSLVYFTYTLLDLKNHKWVLKLNQILGTVFIGISMLVMYDNQQIGYFYNIKQSIQLTMLLSMVYLTFLGLKTNRNLAILVIISWMPVMIYAITAIFNLYPARKIYDPAIMALPVVFEMIVSSIAAYFNMRKIQRDLVESEIRKKQNEVLKQAMRTISHDLANHFFVAEHSIEAIKKTSPLLDHKSHARLDRVQKSLKQSKLLLSRVKCWILAGDGKINVKNEPVAIIPLIKESINLFEERAKAKNIEFSTEWNSELEHVRVWGDPVAIFNQVLNNSLSNAIKFSYRNSKVIIKLHHCPERVYVSIKDSGIGMKKMDQTQFILNGHIESTEGTDNEKGTGFGMRLMKSYMESFDGEVSIQSSTEESSRGTEVILIFKYIDKSAPSHVDEAFSKVGIV